LSLLLAACGAAPATPAPRASPSHTPGEASISTPAPGPSSRPEASAAVAALPPDLADFPVPPGARVLPPEGGILATWAIEPGAAGYRFYLDELPAAGYVITGVAPGGSVAIIRFADGAGTAWQIDIAGDLESAVVELGPERP
jgi:hypothetical protein